MVTVEKINSIYRLAAAAAKDPPATLETMGYELEYAVRYGDAGEELPALPETPLTRLFSRHRDWRYVYEISSPVLSTRITKREAVLGTVMEWMACRDGFIVSDYQYYGGPSRDQERSLSRHIHFRGSPARMARFANWLVLLAALMKPELVMMRTVVSNDVGNYEIREGPDREVWYRQMISHYAAPPSMIDEYLVTEVEEIPKTRWRGYWPDDRNSFYAVELNRYRKEVLTLEFRVNEQHILAVWVLYDILDKLSRRPAPWVADVVEIYNQYVYPRTAVDESVLLKTIKEHEIAKVDDPVSFARWLLEEFDSLRWYTRRLLEIVAREGRRLRYSDYARVWIEIVQELAPEVSDLAREVYECAK